MVHPFNLQNDGSKTYAQWQFEMGERTLLFYLQKYSIDDMLEGKQVLDIGCGAGGKSLYFAKMGAGYVTGVDVVEKYEDESNSLARELSLSDKFKFVLADASKLTFEDESFDTIIMNDAMEHVGDPEAVLDECLRVLCPGGRIFINFPPYNHPFGAHLSDVIAIPYVHMFFSRKCLIEAYKYLVKDLPDANERINFRISKDEGGREYFSYINEMTIKRFNKILKNKNITPAYYKLAPLRGYFSLFARLPVLREMFVKMVVCVIENGERREEN